MENKLAYIILGTIIGIVVTGSVLIPIGVAIAKGGSQGSQESAEDKIAKILSSNVEFPKGASVTSLSNYPNNAPSSWTPRIPDKITLEQSFRVNIDNTNDVLVTSRKTYLYVSLPQSSSAVTSIGIKFDGSDNLHVLPLSLQNSGTDFLVKTSFTDGSVLYQIPITAPSSLCASTTGTHCASIKWQSYTLSSTYVSAASSSSTLTAACGSQCATASNCKKSCETCDKGTVSGADTPVSRYFTMGVSSGTFVFSYETYTIPDRIRIFQGDVQIFDTNCVGNYATKSVTLNGRSDEIRVDVEPNCDGTTGTAWNFNVKCP